ncbi:MAG TPA: cytochrome c biogenesis protein [Candidatus Acidoferrum sp.]|nr:cytochrome c biogenesis protein [Candidatus Acidoferrum sp.]
MKLRVSTTVIVAAMMIFAGYAALFIAPDEQTMHEIQRIFYFHVPSWSASFTAFFVSWIASIAYLSTKRERFDWLAVSAAEVGVIACTIGLVTGPLWAKPVWGIWWTWDMRLTTTFILWLLYISYLLLRGLIEEPARRATLAGVFGVFAFLDVPLVYMSNRLWRTQHPAPVMFGGQGSGLDPTMSKVLGFCIVSVLCLMVIVLVDRYRLEALRHELDELRQEAETRTFDEQNVADGGTQSASSHVSSTQ